MGNKKKKVMSLSIDPDLHERAKVVAERKYDDNVSKLICEVLEKYMGTVEDDGVTAVILKIPHALKGKPTDLRAWLDQKSGAIVKALT